nr:XdhC/CoxI family protein [Chloroflexota bacterium]
MNEDLLSAFDAVRASGARGAVATLVATFGGSSKRLGSRLWVGCDGRRIGSVTLGGCVDGRVAEEAAAVAESGQPRLVNLALGDEDAFDFGMSCGGAIEVFIEPVPAAPLLSPLTAAIEVLRTELGARRSAVLATPLDGSPERPVLLEDSRARPPYGEDLHRVVLTGVAA